MSSDVCQGLVEQIDAAKWEWLREHQQRGVLLLIEELLDLAAVGERLAADDSVTVRSWLASGLVRKPSAEQVACWDQQPDKLFSVLIVSPFVLAQEPGASPVCRTGDK